MNPARLISRALGILKIVRYGDRMRPLRDWLWLIAAALALFLASAAWSYYVFFSTNIEGPKGTAVHAPPPPAPAPLDTINTVFDARAAERAHYLNDYRFVDPSK